MLIKSSLPGDSPALMSRRVFLQTGSTLAMLLTSHSLTAGLQGNLSAPNDLASMPRPFVAALQRKLTEIGESPGSADGIWGPKTAAAYHSFSRSAGLPVVDTLNREHILVLWDFDYDPLNATAEQTLEFLQHVDTSF